MFYRNFAEIEKVFESNRAAYLRESEPISWYEYKDRVGIECEHKTRQPMRWQMSNGVWRVGLFCKACGHKYDTGVKNSDYDMSKLPESDGLWDRYLELNRTIATKTRQHKRLNNYREWRDAATAYYTSPEWRTKKDLVLRRDGYLCQSCLTNPATTAHHTTYEYPFGKEPLYTLESICNQCHEEITRMDRENRGESWLPY